MNPERTPYTEEDFDGYTDDHYPMQPVWGLYERASVIFKRRATPDTYDATFQEAKRRSVVALTRKGAKRPIRNAPLSKEQTTTNER